MLFILSTEKKMIRYFLVFYLAVNIILFLKFSQFTYVEKFEDIQALDRLPSKIYKSHFIQSIKKIKIKKPSKKSWNNNLISELGQSRYLNYGTNLEFDLIANNSEYCIDTPKVIKIFNKNENYFQLSSNYKKLYASNRGMPENNCFKITEDSKLIINIDVLSDKNYLYINNQNTEITDKDILKINPLLLFLCFLVIIFSINIYFLKKHNFTYFV